MKYTFRRLNCIVGASNTNAKILDADSEVLRNVLTRLDPYIYYDSCC